MNIDGEASFASSMGVVKTSNEREGIGKRVAGASTRYAQGARARSGG